MAHGAVLRRLGISLMVVVMAVVAVEPVLLGMGVMVEHSLLSQGGLILAICAVAGGTRAGALLSGFLVGMMAILAVEAIAFAVGLMIKENIAACCRIECSDRNLRGFGWQRAVAQKTYGETGYEDSNPQFQLVLRIHTNRFLSNKPKYL
jgi:hypothetical protein